MDFESEWVVKIDYRLCVDSGQEATRPKKTIFSIVVSMPEHTLSSLVQYLAFIWIVSVVSVHGSVFKQ